MKLPRGGGSVGGGRYGFAFVKGKRARECSRCGAKPGHSCGRWTTLGTWKTVQTPHKER